MYELIAEARELYIQGIETDLELARARARDVLLSDDRVRWPQAWDFMAKLDGAFIQKHEVSGPNGAPIVVVDVGRPASPTEERELLRGLALAVQDAEVVIPPNPALEPVSRNGDS